MATTESLYGQEIYLKVGNYKTNVFEAINEAKDYISRNDCPFLNIDISGLNLIDAMKVCVLASTFHYAKYCNGKVKWFVKDESIKEQITMLKLDNVEIEVKRAKRNYIDMGASPLRNLRLCR